MEVMKHCKARAVKQNLASNLDRLALPSPRKDCSEGHTQIGTGPLKHFCSVYRREDLPSAHKDATLHVWVQSWEAA